MKLLNFLDDPVFNSFRAAMGAPLSGYKVKIDLPVPTFKPRFTPPIVLPLPTEGLEVVGNEISFSNDGTIIYKNRRVLVHIRDATHHTPRFHLTNCVTLVEMKSQGRFEKYVVSEKEDGYFHVRMDGGPLVKRQLPVCQNCLERLSWRGFSSSMNRTIRHGIVGTFSISEFFSKYPNSLHPVTPSHTADSAPKNDYPENWALIASELKRQLGYYCQSCQKVLGESNKRFLHVHHINGLKNDCRVENLQCLCISCHADQPMHATLRALPEYREYKALYP